jgi:hypothetical protein
MRPMDAFSLLSRRAGVAFCAGVAFLLGLAHARGAEAPAAPIQVRCREGELHGLLALRDLAGRTLAYGELLQNVDGDKVTARLVFHFRDGSISDETVVYSQQGRFRVLRDHLVQQGPFFRRAIVLDIDGTSGQATVRATEHGKEKVYQQHIDVPANLANGIVAVALKNVEPAAGATLSMIVATPKPRLVKLHVRRGEDASFSSAGAARKAMHFILKAEIGGAAGAFAPLLGKQPPDAHVWILGGKAPTFVRAQQPFYPEGPEVRIEMVGPDWQR